MTYTDAVDLYYEALRAHATEELAYDDLEYVTNELLDLGLTVRQCLAAFEEAEQL